MFGFLIELGRVFWFFRLGISGPNWLERFCPGGVVFSRGLNSPRGFELLGGDHIKGLLWHSALCSGHPEVGDTPS